MKPRKTELSLATMEEVDREIEELIFNLRPREERSVQINKIRDNFRSKLPVSDYAMDYIFPPEIAKKSHPHWTPTEVASRALELLNTTEESKVLDIGSGCGKFCIIAGLSSKGHFTGIEQRKNLVEVADQITKEFEIQNVSFIHGDMLDIDWALFDSLYLFNPFYEHVMSDPIYWIDDTIPKNQKTFDRYVQSVQTKLKSVKLGTKVVTYHGFGGRLPSEYACLSSEKVCTGNLDLWIKEK